MAGPPGRLRILVAEDSEANRLVIDAMLTERPVTLDFAADGTEAVAAAAQQPYDLILMDLAMPRLDGIAAAQAIRREAACNPLTPIIALTATVTHDIEKRCLAAGMSGYMPKPVARSDLLACLERWAGRLARFEPGDLVDQEALVQLKRDVGPEACSRLLAGFAGETRERQGRLVAAAAAGDAAAVEHEAHALKSTSATYAARCLSAAAARIEAAAEAEALSRAQPDVNRLAALVDASLAALAAQA